MYKNYPAIAGADSPFKEYLIAEGNLTRLARLRLTFPEYFTDSPVEFACYPASTLRQLAEAKSLKAYPREPFPAESDGEFDWDSVIHDDIPRVEFNSHDNPIPPKIWDQLVGQVLRGGIPIEWRGHRYVTVLISPAMERPGKKAVITEKMVKMVTSLTLVPAEYVDLEK